MNIICIGDAVSQEGVEYLSKQLPRLRREYKADAVIVNGENSALGNGIDKRSYDALIYAGADVVTGGNHSFQKRGSQELHDSEKRILRPANLPSSMGGKGVITLDFGRECLRIVNLSGMLYMSDCENPFEYMQKLLEEDDGVATVVDFHAEATSEKRALGFFLDGRVSLVFGTHTHVQTNDAQILPRGTGYVTDIGMTGVKSSVLGKATDCCIHNFMYPDDRVRISDGKGDCILSGIFAQIDCKSKKCTDIQLISVDK